MIFGLLIAIIFVLAVLSGFLYGENATIRGQTTTIPYTSTQTTTYTSTTTSTLTQSFISTTTPLEMLVITSAYANSATQIVLNVRNNGPTYITITDIFVNQKPLANFTPEGTVSPTLPMALATGASQTISINFSSPGLASGVTYQFIINTGLGNQYSKLVVIP